jgi:PDZ domain-containing secreted protein
MSLLLVLLLLGFISTAKAADDDYCAAKQEISQAVVSLEKCAKISVDLSLTEQQNANLLKQLELKDQIIALQEQKIAAMEELMKVRQQISDEQVTAEKKSKWRVGFESFTVGGLVGVIATVIAIITL